MRHLHLHRDTAGEPLSAVDAAWLRMDRPTNRMAITGLVVVRGTLDQAALERVPRERLLVHPRFRQKIVPGPLGRPRWTEDAALSLATHLHRVSLPPPGDDAALRALVGELVSRPLDRAHPLWSAWIVDGYGGNSALVVRLHHCIADGIALVRLLLSLTDHEGPAEAREPGVPPPRETGLRAQLGRLAGGVRSLVHDLALPRDPPTALQGRLGVDKRVAWSRSRPLLPVSEAAHAAGATLTDACLAAIAGALRRHLTAADGSPPTVELRALVPVNLRRVVGGGDAGNRFGLVYVALPLSRATPAERLAAVRERMDAIKRTPEAVMAFELLGAMGLASVAVERLGVELFTSKATVMVTSVPGPTSPVRLAGAPIESLVTWAPASGAMSMTISILSYAGTLQIGVASDANLVPDPHAIAVALDEELDALVAR